MGVPLRGEAKEGRWALNPTPQNQYGSAPISLTSFALSGVTTAARHTSLSVGCAVVPTACTRQYLATNGSIVFVTEGSCICKRLPVRLVGLLEDDCCQRCQELVGIPCCIREELEG